MVVLGIGAAILVLALRFIPTPQKKNRDTARSSDISQIVAAINGYITNNNDLPADWLDVRDTIDSLSHYDLGTSNTAGVTSGSNIPSKSVNVESKATGGNQPNSTSDEKFSPQAVCGIGANTPITANTQIFLHGCATFAAGTPDEDIIYIINNAVCDDAGAQGVIDPGGLRQMAIVYKLETNDQIACQNI